MDLPTLIESLNPPLAVDMSLKTHLDYSLPKDEFIGFHQTIHSKTYHTAKYALVLMIRGINVSWKQPVAYFFVTVSCLLFSIDLNDIITCTLKKTGCIDTAIKLRIFFIDENSYRHLLI